MTEFFFKEITFTLCPLGETLGIIFMTIIFKESLVPLLFTRSRIGFFVSAGFCLSFQAFGIPDFVVYLTFFADSVFAYGLPFKPAFFKNTLRCRIIFKYARKNPDYIQFFKAVIAYQLYRPRRYSPVPVRFSDK